MGIIDIPLNVSRDYTGGERTSMRIVVDAMGTDTHPTADVAGAVMAAREFGDTMILVGDQDQIRNELAKHNTNGLKIDVVHAADSITMDDKPNEIVRGKPESSVHVGIDLVKNGDADAFVSAGNTGATLAVSMFRLRRIRGVKRPALTAVGRLIGNLVTVVDVGANTDTKLEWLQQFALMGNLYTQRVLGVEKPRVGLLSNGEEDGKGNELVREANVAFQAMPFRFIGNVEPSDLFKDKVDVIVTDGYVGNILLKTYEAAIEAVGRELREQLTRNIRAKLGATLVKPYLKDMVTQLDPTQYGGAPLLGVNGVVIVTHGGSSATVIKDSIGQARKAVSSDVIGTIKTGLAEIQPVED